MIIVVDHLTWHLTQVLTCREIGIETLINTSDVYSQQQSLHRFKLTSSLLAQV